MTNLRVADDAAGGFARDETKEIVVPTQKDLKHLVRSRMKKTGEAYTAARLQILNKKNEPAGDHAERAGMSDAARAQADRARMGGVRVLDAHGGSEKPHRDIAKYVSSLGAPDWWAQTVTVGYERIRGLRDKGQRRGGGYEASKSRTFNVPVATLFNAFADARMRRRWLPVRITVRSATPPKRMRVIWEDETVVQLGFTAKGDNKSAVAVQHEKLPNRAAVDGMKKVLRSTRVSAPNILSRPTLALQGTSEVSSGDRSVLHCGQKRTDSGSPWPRGPSPCSRWRRPSRACCRA